MQSGMEITQNNYTERFMAEYPVDTRIIESV